MEGAKWQSTPRPAGPAYQNQTQPTEYTGHLWKAATSNDRDRKALKERWGTAQSVVRSIQLDTLSKHYASDKMATLRDIANLAGYKNPEDLYKIPSIRPLGIAGEIEYRSETFLYCMDDYIDYWCHDDTVIPYGGTVVQLSHVRELRGQWLTSKDFNEYLINKGYLLSGNPTLKPTTQLRHKTVLRGTHFKSVTLYPVAEVLHILAQRCSLPMYEKRITTTQEMYDRLHQKWSVSLAHPIPGGNLLLRCDPWVLGYWLGNTRSELNPPHFIVTGANAPQRLDHLVEQLKMADYDVTVLGSKVDCGTKLTKDLLSTHIYGFKYIPAKYLRSKVLWTLWERIITMV